MNIIDLTFKSLYNGRESFHSGQVLADRFGVSRNAINKAINNLRREGFIIESDPKKGYRLTNLPKNLNKRSLEMKLQNFSHIEVLEETTSTNDIVKNHFATQGETPVLITAEKQATGRGRQGRPFYSDIRQGLYFSFGLTISPEERDTLEWITLKTAVAIHQALEPHLDEALQVKWVNDLFYKGRKVGGILTEASHTLEDLDPIQLTVGIGLNIAGSIDDFPKDLQNIAGTLFEADHSLDLNALISDFFRHFKSLDRLETLDIYSKNLLGLGKKVYYKQGPHQKSGIIQGIDPEGHLLISQKNSTVETLRSGEIHFTSAQFTEDYL